MNPQALARYNEILRKITLRNGVLVSDYPSVYSWMDHDWDHGKKCELRSDQDPKEITYSMFVDTFADLEMKHAIEVDDVSCACGELLHRTIRWETTVHDALYHVINDVIELLEPRTDKECDK